MFEVIVLPDAHLPFTDWKVVQSAYEFYIYRKLSGAKIKVIQIGDLTDQKAWSRFQKDPDDFSPYLEWEETMKCVARLKEMFPEMTVLMGNHDRRVAMKAVEAGLPSQLVKTLPEVLNVPEWLFHTDSKPYQFQGITYLHGDEFGGKPLIKAQHLGTPLIMGHTHKMTLEYGANIYTDIWAVECGNALDENSPAARYSSRSVNKGTKGFVHLDVNGIPHLYPMKGK